MPWPTAASAVMVLMEASAKPLRPISRSAASRIFWRVRSPRLVLGAGRGWDGLASDMTRTVIFLASLR